MAKAAHSKPILDFSLAFQRFAVYTQSGCFGLELSERRGMSRDFAHVLLTKIK